MGHLAETVVQILTHPITLIGLLVFAGVWIVLGRELHRLDAIIHELRALPSQKRRYTLERTHKIYPGTENLPIAFVRQRRRRLLTCLCAGTLVFVVVIAGYAIRGARRANAVSWTLDDSRLAPEQFGYKWQIELINESNEAVRFEHMDLKVLARNQHPETDRKRPEYSPNARNASKQAVLKPNADIVPIVRPAEQYFLAPLEKTMLTVFLDGYHSAHEGWIYDVQLAVQWQVREQTAMLTKLGSVYRIGWPGMPNSTETDPSAGPVKAPVTDPVVELND